MNYKLWNFKSTIILFILAMLSLNVFSQNQDKIDRELRAKNKIAKILTYKQEIKGGPSILVLETICDNTGNIIKETMFNNNRSNSKSFESIFEYKNDLLVKETQYFNGEIVGLRTYVYDENRNQIEYKYDFYEHFKKKMETIEFQKKKYNNKNQNTELYVWDKNHIYSADTFFLQKRYLYTDFNLYAEIVNPPFGISSKYEYNANNKLHAIYETKIFSGVRRRTLLNEYKDDLLIRTEEIFDRLLGKEGEGYKTVTIVTEYEYDSEQNIIEKLTLDDDRYELLSYSFEKFN